MTNGTRQASPLHREGDEGVFELRGVKKGLLQMAPNASIGVLMSKKDPTVEKLKGYARFEGTTR